MTAKDRRFRFGGGLCVLFLLATLSKGQQPAPGASPQEQEPATSSPAPEIPQEQGGAPVALRSDSNYEVGPEDILDIDIFDFPELSKPVRVSNDGTITLPLVGQVKAAGLTTLALAKALESEYSRIYLQNPQVTVGVREFHARPVSVVGAVEKPGLYPLSGPRRLVEMLSLAGGPRNSGGTVMVTRPGGFGALEMGAGMRLAAPDQVEFDLQRLYYAHDPALDILIRPLDAIAVNKADIIYVQGAVKFSSGYVLADRPNVTVMQALAMAGGLDWSAARKRARIIRQRPDGSKLEIPLDLGRILKGKAEDVQMASNDILYVPYSGGKNAARRGADLGTGVMSGLIIYHRY